MSKNMRNFTEMTIKVTRHEKKLYENYSKVCTKNDSNFLIKLCNCLKINGENYKNVRNFYGKLL